MSDHPIDCGDPAGCSGCVPEGAERCEDCEGVGMLVSPAGVDFCHICDGQGYVAEGDDQ
jgi:DnaJ-class molecular chaperone